MVGRDGFEVENSTSVVQRADVESRLQGCGDFVSDLGLIAVNQLEIRFHIVGIATTAFDFEIRVVAHRHLNLARPLLAAADLSHRNQFGRLREIVVAIGANSE